MTTRLSGDPADQRRCHAILLTGHTDLAANESFEWMTIKGDTTVRRAWRDLDEFLEKVDQAILEGCNVYIGLGVRRCPNGGVVGRCGCKHAFDREHVSRVMAAAADLDVKPPPKGFPSKAMAYDAVKTARRSPSFIVDSGGGLQVYWAFEEPLADLARFTNIQRGIAKFFGSDPIIDPSRVLRLAGTVNHKDGKPRPTKILKVVVE